MHLIRLQVYLYVLFDLSEFKVQNLLKNIMKQKLYLKLSHESRWRLQHSIVRGDVYVLCHLIPPIKRITQLETDSYWHETLGAIGVCVCVCERERERKREREGESKRMN